MVIVNLLLATICFSGECYPALVGPATPTGSYTMTNWKTHQPGYGGDVMVFKEDTRTAFAIHRVYLLNPKQKRLERLTNGDVTQRKSITDGCINIMPDVYQKLVDCCNGQTLHVVK